MSKELEALDEIFDIIYNLNCATTYEQDVKLDNLREIIKKELKEAQEQEKVLKIIDEKNVDINGLKKCIELDLPLTDEQRLHKYNHDYMMIGMKQLTQEEFELLKRWLSDGKQRTPKRHRK